MKKFLYVLVCLLLIAGIGGSAYLLKGDSQGQKTETSTEQSSESMSDMETSTEQSSESMSDTETSTEQSSESMSDMETSEDSSDDMQTEVMELKGLKIPNNEEEYIAEGLTMWKGATLDFTEGERALRFTCEITSELYEDVIADENKSLGMLLIPQKFYDQVNVGKYTYIDWINAFNEAGITSYHYLIYTDNFGDTETGKYMRFRLWDMGYTTIVQNITCIGVLSTQNADGSVTYQYAGMPKGETYQSNSRSISYVAAENLNDYVLGLADYDDAQLAKLRGYINETVDLMNGLSEATDDGSTFEIAFEHEDPQMSVGETLDLSVVVTPGLEMANTTLRIVFQSTDTDVVTVDEQGKVTALQSGTAIIKAYIAGEFASITITVL